MAPGKPGFPEWFQGAVGGQPPPRSFPLLGCSPLLLLSPACLLYPPLPSSSVSEEAQGPGAPRASQETGSCLLGAPSPSWHHRSSAPTPQGSSWRRGQAQPWGSSPGSLPIAPASGHTISLPRRLTLRRPPCSELLSPLFGKGPLVPETLITGWRFLKSRPQGLAVSATASPVFCSGAPRQPCQAAALPTSPSPLPRAARRPAGVLGWRSGLVSQRLGRAVCMCAHLCVCASVCARVYLCVRVLYAYTCVHACIHLHMCTHVLYACTSVCACFSHTYTCACMWAWAVCCLHLHVYVHEHTCVHWYTHVYPCLCSHVWGCVRVGRCVHMLLLGVPGTRPPLPGCLWVMDELWCFPGSIPAF